MTSSTYTYRLQAIRNIGLTGFKSWFGIYMTETEDKQKPRQFLLWQETGQTVYINKKDAMAEAQRLAEEAIQDRVDRNVGKL